VEEIQQAQASPEDIVKSSVVRSWETLLRYPVALIVGGILVMVIGAVSLGILAVPLLISYTRVLRRALAGEQVAIGDVFNDFGETIVPGVLTAIVIGLGTFLGMLLLVIPGLIFLVICSFAIQALAYRDASGPIEAIQQSYAIVKAHLGPVVAILVVNLVINAIASLVAIGAIISLPLTLLIGTAVYESLRRELPAPGS
jgi:uncharacterized membrane protein